MLYIFYSIFYSFHKNNQKKMKKLIKCFTLIQPVGNMPVWQSLKFNGKSIHTSFSILLLLTCSFCIFFAWILFFVFFFVTKGIKSVRKYAIFMLPFALNYAQCRQSGETERERERERERKRARCTCGQGLHCPLINVTLIMWPRVCWLHFTVTLHAVCPHSALESLVVALIEQQQERRRMSRTIHKNAMSIAFFALWHLSLFLSCAVCVDWKRLGKSTHTHTRKCHEWERERETGKWKLATGKGSRQMHLESRHKDTQSELA